MRRLTRIEVLRKLCARVLDVLYVKDRGVF